MSARRARCRAGCAHHGYTTAFYWSAAIFALGAIAAALLLEPKARSATLSVAEPLPAQ
ncbi:MAG: hypothetical protein ACR2ND_01355 [Solirubrobacteraceae bacterium]